MQTALEGGINYWCNGVRVKSVPKENEGKYDYASDVISLGGSLELFDLETDEVYTLTYENFMNGVKLYCINNGVSNATELINNHDVDTVDSIIQYAIFNELIFC